MKDKLKFKEFIGSAQYSAKDEVYYGKIEGINDLVSFEGNTLNKLRWAFKEAVNDYVGLCKDVNHSV